MHLRKHPSVSLLHAQPPLTNNTYNSQQWHFPNIHQLHQTTNNQLVSSWILACFPTHRRKLTARSLCAPQCHHRYTTHSSHSSRTHAPITHLFRIPNPIIVDRKHGLCLREARGVVHLAHTVIPSPLAEVEAGGGGVGHDVATDGLLVITPEHPR